MLKFLKILFACVSMFKKLTLVCWYQVDSNILQTYNILALLPVLWVLQHSDFAKLVSEENILFIRIELMVRIRNQVNISFMNLQWFAGQKLFAILDLTVGVANLKPARWDVDWSVSVSTWMNFTSSGCRTAVCRFYRQVIKWLANHAWIWWSL